MNMAQNVQNNKKVKDPDNLNSASVTNPEDVLFRGVQYKFKQLHF